MKKSSLVKSVLVIGLALGSVACGLFKSEPQPPQPERVLVGTVDSVHPAGFVLIRLNGRATAPAEAVLVSEGPGGRANLRLTGEKVGLFAAADLRSGSPARHDGVYLYQKLAAGGDSPSKAKAQLGSGLTYGEGAADADAPTNPGNHAESALPTPRSSR